MKYLDLSPNLMVKDVRKAIDFYTGLLGFKLLATVPETSEGPLDFAIIQSDNFMIMLQDAKSLKEELPQLLGLDKGGALTFYIHVSDVQQLYDKLKGKVTLVKDMHDTFYGSRDFAIEDLDGFILVFSQQMTQ